MESNVTNTSPKPKPPVASAKPVETPVQQRKPFVPKPHLTHQPFKNRGMADLKVNLKKR